MGRRYSDIRRAAQLKAALDNYVDYLQTPRPPRLNTKGPRDNSQVVFLAPFTISVGTDEVVAARVNPAHYTKLGATINGASGAEVLAAIGTKELIDLGQFTAARLVLFENSTRSVTVETSEVTGTQYLKYAGERYSCPFGAQAATDDMIDAYQAAKAAVLVAGVTASADVKRVSLIREKAPSA
jgi:hypothetical protein